VLTLALTSKPGKKQGGEVRQLGQTMCIFLAFAFQNLACRRKFKNQIFHKT